MSKLVGFLVYHNPQKRTRFVDQLFISKKYRRHKFATMLLKEITNGPIELIVNEGNVSAIAFYTALQFCSVYDTRKNLANDEILMKTKSYLTTKQVIKDKTAKTKRELTFIHKTYKDASEKEIKFMKTSLNRSSHMVNDLYESDPNTRYIFAYI